MIVNLDTVCFPHVFLVDILTCHRNCTVGDDIINHGCVPVPAPSDCAYWLIGTPKQSYH